MRHLLAAAACIACAGALAADPLDFKGIALGAEFATIERDARFACRTGDSPLADNRCTLRPGERETVAGAPVHELSLLFYGGRLHTIFVSFEEKHFDDVVAALRQRYGEAGLKTEFVRSAAGATLENPAYTWRRAGASLEAKRYVGRLSLSALRLRSDAALEEFGRRKDALVRERARDL